jgi:hypothetical protein
VTIEATYDHPPDQPPAWDDINVRALRAAEFDLAFLPARAWRSAGVTTLEPLQLPFLVEDDDQADRVAMDRELTEALMAGLSNIDVTGLGVFPEGIRRIVRVDGTKVSPAADLAGVTVRAPLSDTTWEVLRGLGADVVDLNGQELVAAYQSGAVNGVETSISLAIGLEGAGSTSVLANIPLYTKFNVLAAADDALADLDEPIVQLLHDATATALQATLADRPRESDALAEACTAGLGTVVATAADRRAVRDRLHPVIERIIVATNIGGLVEQVRVVAGEASAEELLTCPSAGGPPRADPADLRPDPGELPNGTYRFVIDAEVILAAYPEFPRSVDGYSGVLTVELDDGTWRLTAIGSTGVEFRYSNVYEVRGDVATFAVPSGTDVRIPLAVQWRWAAHPDGSLSFEPVGPRDRGLQVDYTDLWTVPVWEPID